MSAEHGIGIQKPQYIYHSKSREAVEMMRRVKKIFDPKVGGVAVWPHPQAFGCMALCLLVMGWDTLRASLVWWSVH